MIPILLKNIQWLKNEIRGWLLLKGIMVLLPLATLFMLTNNAYWLQVSVLTMSSFIIEETLQLTVVGMLLHGFSVISLFYLLFLTQLHPMLFILSCTLSATATILITAKGDQLRALGNWTFIPAIILAIELTAEIKPELYLQGTDSVFPYLVGALIPTLLLSLFHQIRAWQKGQIFKLIQLSYLPDFGNKSNYIESMIAMAMGVSIAACFVEYLPMDHGQWMIWGVASVITGDIETTPKKFHQRLIGVLIGVPIGIVLGQFVVPYTPFYLTLTTGGIYLTLVAFRRYVIAYSLRCTFVAMAIMLITHSRTVAFERLSHVIAGGVIGVICVMLSHFLTANKKT